MEFSNIIFSAIFAIEMLLKIIAEGPLNYIGNGFNVFDGVIVILRYILKLNDPLNYGWSIIQIGNLTTVLYFF